MVNDNQDGEIAGGNNRPDISNENVAYLKHGAFTSAYDLEAALSNVISDETEVISSPSDFERGRRASTAIADIIGRYNQDKTINVTDFIANYTFHPAFVTQFIKDAGNLDVTQDSNKFYVVAVLRDKNEATLKLWPEFAIVTTIKTKDRNLSFFNGIKTRIEHSSGGADVFVYTSSLNDVVNIIDGLKSEYADFNKAKRDDVDGDGKDRKEKEESRARKVFRSIVVEALKRGASDIHIMQRSNIAYIKFTIGGVVSDYDKIDKNLADRLIVSALLTKSPEYSALASPTELADPRIVELIEFDREVHLQDGTVEIVRVKELVTLRVGKTPSNYGPHTTMRILRETDGEGRTLKMLGHDNDNVALLETVIQKPSGILLMTGPTGSGKTTTLAACYEGVSHEKKIIVLEDPIEIKLNHPHAVQSAVQPDNEKKGYNAFLRLALRQAPHVIGISEIRDSEVAAMCFRAAMTGHLMISTIHTNGAIDTIVRLKDLGIDYSLMAVEGLLDTIAAQRLLRKLCVYCRQEYVDANPLVGKAYKCNTEGCAHCIEGYSGRVLVSEVLVFDDRVRELLLMQNNTTLIRQYVKSQGWRSMADRALEKVRRGEIDVSEARAHVQGFLDESNEINYAKIALKG